jgi:hypothetical protein
MYVLVQLNSDNYIHLFSASRFYESCMHCARLLSPVVSTSLHTLIDGAERKKSEAAQSTLAWRKTQPYEGAHVDRRPTPRLRFWVQIFRCLEDFGEICSVAGVRGTYHARCAPAGSAAKFDLDATRRVASVRP